MDIFFASSSNLSTLLAPIATFAPAFDSAKAVAYPMPLLAPVIIATLSLII